MPQHEVFGLQENNQGESAMITRHVLALTSSLALLALPVVAMAQAHDASMANHQPHYYNAVDYDIDAGSVTYADDIAPLLQRSCQNCHRPGGGAPMSLLSYDEVKPWAPVIMYRTAIRDRMGAMPPFFIEKNIGIDGFKNDYSLSDLELAMIQALSLIHISEPTRPY